MNAKQFLERIENKRLNSTPLYSREEMIAFAEKYAKQLTIQRVVVNEATVNNESILDEPQPLYKDYEIEDESEVELCECNWPLIRTGTKERAEYCGNCGKDI